jgi:hypothetical protein
MELGLLVEETMAFVRSVSGDASKKIDFRQTVASRESQGAARHPELCNCQWQPKSRRQKTD